MPATTPAADTVDPRAATPVAATSVSKPEDPETTDEHPIYDGKTMSQIVIFLIGTVTVFVVLWQAQGFFAPVLSAFVLGIVLSPLSRFWHRLRLRPSLAALATLVIVLLALVCIVFIAEPYVSQAVNRAPIIWAEFRDAIEGIRNMLQGLDELTKDVAASVDPETGKEAAKEGGVAVPSATDALFYAPQVLGQVMIFSGALYFFLLSKFEIYGWIGKSLRNVEQSDFEFAERRVADYFLTITTINACFGLLVAGVMHLLGMPAAGFWGLAAFLLNYILYLGPIFLAAALLVTGLVVFDGPISVAPALIYMTMNAMEGQFITPAFVGQQMRINPLLVFLSLVFWLWLWGPIGGIIAIPLMIWTIGMAEAVMGQPIATGLPARRIRDLEKKGA